MLEEGEKHVIEADLTKPLPQHSNIAFMNILNSLVKPAIFCASFFLFVFSFEINEYFDSFALYAPGINLIFIPAGFKLLCVLLGGEAAAAGLLLSSIYVSYRVWDHTSLMQMIYFAFASVGSYYITVLLVKKILRINDTLSNLRYLHIIIFSAAASITNGTLHNIVYVWQDKVKLEEFLAHSTAMIFGDFLGCFIVIMFFNICIDLALSLLNGKRKEEEKGIRFIAHLLNRTQA